MVGWSVMILRGCRVGPCCLWMKALLPFKRRPNGDNGGSELIVRAATALSLSPASRAEGGAVQVSLGLHKRDILCGQRASDEFERLHII